VSVDEWASDPNQGNDSEIKSSQLFDTHPLAQSHLCLHEEKTSSAI